MSENIDFLKRYNVINKAFHPEDGYLASSCIVWYVKRYSFYKSAGFIRYDRDYPWIKK